MNNVAQGARWRYVGPGPALSRGVVHTITAVTQQAGGVLVTTWSDSYGNGGGDAWMGGVREFLENFRSTGPAVVTKEAA